MRFNQAAAAAGSLTPPPKLSLFLFPAGAKKGVFRPGPPSTPPLNSLDVSIPFKWEEAPGKPRPRRQLLIDDEDPKAAATATTYVNYMATPTRGLNLKLPPRLLSSSSRRVSNININIPSPGAAGSSCVFQFQGEDGGDNDYRPAKRCSSFTYGSGGVGMGSSGWRKLMMTKKKNKKKKKSDDDHDQVVGNNGGINSGDQSSCYEGQNGVRIIRIKRVRSLFNLATHSRLARMYKSFKNKVAVSSRGRE